jgi:YfiH family protein
MSRAPLLTARVGSASVWCSGREQGNVGDHTGDDPRAVARRRADLAVAAGLPAPTDWVWLRQVHGPRVYDAHAPTEPDAPPEADAAVTGVRGLPLAIVTADCAPVVVASDGAVAVAHAGHRGLAAGVLEAAVAAVRARSEGAVRAFLGPCIHPARYEFGADDLDALVAQFGPQVAARTRDGAPAFDIPAAVRILLARASVDDVVDCGVCTADSPAYFSYRAEHTPGRQVTVAVLT